MFKQTVSDKNFKCSQSTALSQKSSRAIFDEFLFFISNESQKFSCISVIYETRCKDSCDCHFSFPAATNDTLLSKFHHHHSKGNVYYEAPQKRETAFTVVHYAGKVKYQIKVFLVLIFTYMYAINH